MLLPDMYIIRKKEKYYPKIWKLNLKMYIYLINIKIIWIQCLALVMINNLYYQAHMIVYKEIQ